MGFRKPSYNQISTMNWKINVNSNIQGYCVLKHEFYLLA